VRTALVIWIPLGSGIRSLYVVGERPGRHGARTSVTWTCLVVQHAHQWRPGDGRAPPGGGNGFGQSFRPGPEAVGSVVQTDLAGMVGCGALVTAELVVVPGRPVHEGREGRGRERRREFHPGDEMR